MDAYLSFLFSMISPFSLSRRIAVLDEYVQYFGSQQGNVRRRIAFFSRHNFSITSKFSSLELFPKKHTIIMRAPIPQRTEGDIFLEIVDHHLCREVEDFYTIQVETIRNPLNLLDIGKATLMNRLDGMPMEDSLVWFYRKCQKIMEFSTDPHVIYQNFNPEVQAILDEVKSE